MITLDKTLKPRLRRSLLGWYGKNRRDLPWRHTEDPYRILVVEYMSQQTQIVRVIPYHERFINRFPNVHALARASTQSVLKAWEGLGYYGRARHLHTAAKMIVREFAGRIPDTYEGLLNLPGCGPYTAAATASIAFNRRVPVVDGNVIRLLCRVFGIHEDPRSQSARTRLQGLAKELMPTRRIREFNEGMMELGALICRPQSPRCDECCWTFACQAVKLPARTVLPLKVLRSQTPHFEIALGIVWKDGRVLIAQRNESGLLGGLWEFPGGKREPGESLIGCCAREIEEEVGINVRVGRKVAIIRHAYSHFRVTLHVFQCQYVGGTPRPMGCQRVRWVSCASLTRYPFPSANKTIVDQLQKKSCSPA